MIETKGLCKNFDKSTALKNVDVKIPEGSVFGVVGSNGSGKSTLLRLIAGVYYADGGEILVDGENPFNNNKIKEEICYLPDTPFFLHQSNLNEMKKFYKMMYPKFNEDTFNTLGEIFKLNVKQRISAMSKGMQRKAALMLSLSTSPKYLLLDEAFDGLDPVMRKGLKSIIAENADKNLTTVIASHNLRDLDELCDSIAIIHNGNIIYCDEIYKLKSNIHKVQAVFKEDIKEKDLEGLNVLKTEKTGSVLSLVIKGESSDISNRLSALNPTFLEIVEPSFEEIFIYEMEENGYDAKEILV